MIDKINPDQSEAYLPFLIRTEKYLGSWIHNYCQAKEIKSHIIDDIFLDFSNYS